MIQRRTYSDLDNICFNSDYPGNLWLFFKNDILDGQYLIEAYIFEMDSQWFEYHRPRPLCGAAYVYLCCRSSVRIECT